MITNPITKEPLTPTEIRRLKLLKHLVRARIHLNLIEHLVPNCCQSSFAEINSRLKMIERFAAAKGEIQ